MNDIPEMTDPLSKGWQQPDLSKINFVDGFAEMSQNIFEELGEYSMSIPSDVYPGKVWKANKKQTGWWLNWFAGKGEDRCVILGLPIRIKPTVEGG